MLRTLLLTAAGCQPQPVRSDAIDWAPPDIWVAHGERTWFPDPRIDGSFPVDWRIRDARDALRDVRKWTQRYHERYEAFDEVECRGRVKDARDGKVRVRLVDAHPVTDAWRFLARLGDTQYLCRPTSWSGREIEGEVLDSVSGIEGPGPGNGVLLYRPVYLRPPVPERPDDREAEYEALRREIGQVLATHGSPKQRPNPQRVGRARILELQRKDGRLRVKISEGANDGLALHDEFRVQRGGTFVGFLGVVEVGPDSSIGEFDLQFPGPGAPPRAGDIVSNGRPLPRLPPR